MSQLEKNLFEPCIKGQSGVVFISTNNNLACQIVIEDGILKAANIARLKLKGMEAIQELKKIGIRGATFQYGLKLNYKNVEKIEQGDLALSLLGYTA